MKQFLTILCMCFAVTAFAQSGSISGTVMDKDGNEPLLGATVVIKDSGKGTVTDFDGNFKIANVENGSYTIVVSYIGYIDQTFTKTVSGGDVNLGEVSLESSSVGLNEVQVFASLITDRETPVAVSTVKAQEIEAKIGSQELPEILKATPGVYATKGGGGFGDGNVRVRGFSSENVAVMINGIPVNDMENGRVYWSNWAGIADAAQTVQVQRGLGASKIAVPSVGGTINIVSKASDREKGGNFYTGIGNDGFSKQSILLSTGLTDNGWALTMSGSRTKQDGYVRGTQALGYSYFFNLSKKINSQHEVVFTALGAKQRHGQRENRQSISTYENSPDGIRYNADWGYLNGQVVHVEDNFYHKPQISLNHYWTLSENIDISTSVYASFGTGGGGGTAGDFQTIRTGGQYGPMNLDTLVTINEANIDGSSSAILRASHNNHNWYGALSTLKVDYSNLSILAGIDGRYYRGQHYRQITNLLGGEYYLDDNDVNNPINLARVGDKYSYNNDGIVGWTGLFTQLEYKTDIISAFVAINGAGTFYKRIDYFNYLDSDPLQETRWVPFYSYGIKGGANYKLTNNHSIFFNGGFFERAPFFDAVFQNFRNDINSDAENQKIISAELGYSYRNRTLTANINAYNTWWRDRTFIRSIPTPDGADDLFANISGVNALHQGIEMDAVYKPFKKIKVTGMVSVGNWFWSDNINESPIFDGEQNVVDVIEELRIKNIPVGEGPQTTAALGVQYELLPGLKAGVDYNYYDRLFGEFNPINRGDDNADPWKAPAYHIVDFNLTYDFDFAGFKSSLYGNIYNIGDVERITEVTDGSLHTAADAIVFYDRGINWNLGMKLRF